MCSLIFASRKGFGTAPITVSTCFPSLKKRMLGMERIPNLPAVDWLVSTSSFPTFKPLFRVYLRQIRNDGSHHPAGSAPGRPEVNNG
jgi:hypothetical protein